METESGITEGWFAPFAPVVKKVFLEDAACRRLLDVEAERAAPSPSPWRLYVGIGCCIVVPLILVGISLLFSHFMLSRYARRRYAQLLDPASLANGRVRMAYPLMFNSLFMQGKVPVAPGLVLIVDDDGPDPSEDEMIDLVMLITVASRKDKDRKVRALAALMSDETYTPQRRRLIDPSFTLGRVIYAADLMADRAELVSDLDSHPMIPCFVGRGPRAVTRVVPAMLIASVVHYTKMAGGVMADGAAYGRGASGASGVSGATGAPA